LRDAIFEHEDVVELERGIVMTVRVEATTGSGLLQ
jgi:hypothetical protein